MPRPGTPIAHPGLLGQARPVTEAAMPDLADLIEETIAPDGAGGGTATSTVYATDVPCRVVPIGRDPQAAAVAAQLQTAADWAIVVPVGVDITRAKRITVGERAFDVTAAISPHSFEPEQRIVCVEVTR